ncbi:MAG: hypothetical protein EXS13_00025 [Planctomycetes bacterium]|nr:hypothetical protein [Planctomycetota bacterium]
MEKPRIGVVFGEVFEGYERILFDAARRRNRALDVRAGYGHAAASELAVQALIDNRVGAIVLFPSSPDLLQRAKRLAAESSVPILFALRSDGRSGPWAGVASDTLAADAGARVAELLGADGIREPTIVAFEDARWPESHRRVESVLDSIERKLGRVQVRLRMFEEGGVEPTVAKAIPMIGRIGRVDLFVAGDPASTAAAQEAATRAGYAATAFVVGISDDAERLATAAASARTVLIGYEREACVEAIFAGLDALTATPPPDPAVELRFTVPCQMHAPAAPR